MLYLFPLSVHVFHTAYKAGFHIDNAFSSARFDVAQEIEKQITTPTPLALWPIH
jgi:hypothetical protein